MSTFTIAVRHGNGKKNLYEVEHAESHEAARMVVEEAIGKGAVILVGIAGVAPKLTEKVPA